MVVVLADTTVMVKTAAAFWTRYFRSQLVVCSTADVTVERTDVL